MGTVRTRPISATWQGRAGIVVGSGSSSSRSCCIRKAQPAHQARGKHPMQEHRLRAKRSLLAFGLDLVGLVTGGIAVILGSVVLLGWYLHSPGLVQVRPTFAPMQYNAALSFLLCGLGLLALSWGRTRLEVVCGIVVATIGLLTLYEYLFGFNLGLDQFFIQSFTTIRTSHPGRMAPQAALSFFLMGIVLVV